MMFDFPDPLGPTTQVIPGSKRRVVAEAKDLNPFKVNALRYIALTPYIPSRFREYPNYFLPLLLALRAEMA